MRVRSRGPERRASARSVVLVVVVERDARERAEEVDVLGRELQPVIASEARRSGYARPSDALDRTR